MAKAGLQLELVEAPAASRSKYVVDVHQLTSVERVVVLDLPRQVPLQANGHMSETM